MTKWVHSGPSSYSATVEGVKLVVAKDHRHQPVKWTMHCAALGMHAVCTGLPSHVSPAIAQSTARNMAAAKARAIAAAISGIE